MINVGFTSTYTMNGSTNIYDRFKFSFNTITRDISNSSWFDECVNTARYIKNHTDKEIIIALSGGIDSESVCWAFMKANIPFSVLTMVHEGNTNDHDTIYAKKFCEAHGIKQQFVNLNMYEFLTNAINKYIEQGYQSKNVFRYLQLFLLETITNMNGCAVLGGGEQLYTTDKNGKVNLYIEPSHLNSLIWCERNNVLHFPYFYQTTPEIIASYINQECVSFLINKPEYFLRKDMTNTSLLLKMMVYHHYIEGLTPRSKFHGFENIQQLRRDTQEMLENQFPNIQYVSISVDEVKRQLGLTNF